MITLAKARSFLETVGVVLGVAVVVVGGALTCALLLARIYG